MEKRRDIRQKGRAWVISLVLFFFASVASATDPSPLLTEANRLLYERQEQAALALFEQVLALDPTQIDALCQASLLHAHLGSRVFDETARGEHYRAAEAHATKAVTLEPENPEANFAMATAYNHLGQVANIRQKMVLLRDMKYYIDSALAKDSSHAGSWHLLGRWHFRAANYSLPELLLTKVVMRGFAKDASNEMAVASMEKAIALAPHDIRFYYDLARIHNLNRNYDACGSILLEALKLEMVTDEELEIHRKCKALLRNLKSPTT